MSLLHFLHIIFLYLFFYICFLSFCFDLNRVWLPFGFRLNPSYCSGKWSWLPWCRFTITQVMSWEISFNDFQVLSDDSDLSTNVTVSQTPSGIDFRSGKFAYSPWSQPIFSTHCHPSDNIFRIRDFTTGITSAYCPTRSHKKKIQKNTREPCVKYETHFLLSQIRANSSTPTCYLRVSDWSSSGVIRSLIHLI